jgi:haloalkane dehalogenase
MTTLQPASTPPSWVDDEPFPFKSRFMEMDGPHVHYVDEGSGLLLLHGNPTWSFDDRDVERKREW